MSTDRVGAAQKLTIQIHRVVVYPGREDSEQCSLSFTEWKLYSLLRFLACADNDQRYVALRAASVMAAARSVSGVWGSVGRWDLSLFF